MINGNSFQLTSNMVDVIKEGIKVQSDKINHNNEKIEFAVSNKDGSLTVGQIEELVLVNQVLQKQVNEAEELLNKPTPRGCLKPSY